MTELPTGLKKAAVLCILTSEAGMLLLKRGKEPNSGFYVPVGGKINPYEEPKDAIVREILEKAGVIVKPENLRLIGLLVETSPTKYNWVSFIYVTHVEHFQPGECDEGELEWIALDRLDAIPTPATDRFIYAQVEQGIFFAFNATYDEETQLCELSDQVSGKVLFER